jgi:hypothetical protein
MFPLKVNKMLSFTTILNQHNDLFIIFLLKVKGLVRILYNNIY